MSRLSVVAGKSSEELAGKVARRLGAGLVRTRVVTFPDGESKITLRGALSGEKVVVVQSIHPPVDTNLVQALSLVARAREAAPRVVAVVPYLGYARQDREFLPGEIVATKVLARLFRGAGASEIVVVDVHSKAGLGHFKIKSTNVSAVPALARHFRKMRLGDPVAVSPDQGGRERAEEFARLLGTDCVALSKERDRRTGSVRIKTKGADGIAGRDVILVDDMVSTGGSIIKATEFLRGQKCGEVFVACTHGLMAGDAVEKIRGAGVAEIVSSNTVPGRTASVDVSAEIAGAIA